VRYPKILRFFVLLFFAMGWWWTTGTARAWEFSMTGGLVWKYDYRGQLGSAGFFGPYNRDNGGNGIDVLAGEYASANSWLGYFSSSDPSPTGDMVTGTDGSRALYQAWFAPLIRINPALSVSGRLRSGPGQLLYEKPGFDVMFANMEWTLMWFTAKTPWGTVLFGKRPFGMGCGLQFDAGNRTDESLMLVSAYGPLEMGLGWYPWRRGSIAYGNILDKSGSTSVDLVTYVAWNSTNWSLGMGGTYVRFREGPEAIYNVNPLFPNSKSRFRPLDVHLTEGWTFAKFNNGRVYLNLEADWYYRTNRFGKSEAGIAAPQEFDSTDGRGSVFRPTYVESWRHMAEIGVLAGPARISFLYAFLPGPDRRRGVLIDRQPYILGPDVANTGLFRPYSFILNAGYASGAGAGFEAFDSTVTSGRDALNHEGEGYMSDASVLALRLDYAAAANLNVFASVLHANRVSDGYGWGFIKPRRNWGTNTATVNFIRQGVDPLTYDPAPTIPDKDLGWEVDLGMSWQLLEGWTLHMNTGYWRPGRWWNFACADREVPNWNSDFYYIPQTTTSANSWGTNPDRPIDGIIATEIVLSTEF
jgi:hypothetical protein